MTNAAPSHQPGDVMVATYSLRRHTPNRSARTAEAYANGWRWEEITGHPPIPDVMDALKRRLHDRLSEPGDPVLWWPHDVVWCVVTDLHRAGRHVDACVLAVLLVWCEAQGGDSAWGIHALPCSEETQR